MRVLQQGSQGSDVRRWQIFLIGQKIDAAPADGDFGPRTHRATLQFQTRHGLYADGIVGLRTLGAAMKLGFEAVKLPASKPSGPIRPTSPSKAHAGDASWPPRPGFSPILSTAAREKMWGRFRFEPQPVEGNRENIRILGDWESENLVRVEIPQIRGIAGAPASTSVRFHKRAADQLRELWRAWERAGLLDEVLTWDGGFSPRFVRGSTSVLSNHAHGTAFDINAAWNALGVRPALVGQRGSVRELVPIANQHGFFWGGHFRDRADGMHFEVARDL